MAKLKVTYNREVLDDGYLLEVEVAPHPDTEPAGDLEKSIVLDTQREEIARFATLTDLVALVEAPLDVVWFQPATYGSGSAPQVGDVLSLSAVPAVWRHLEAAPLPWTFSVLEVDGPAGARSLRVAAPFPCGLTGRETTFRIYRAGVPVTTEHTEVFTATRYNPRASDNPMYVRTASALSVYSSVTAGANKLEALRAQASALVLHANVAEQSFDGTLEEEYT